jgi:hypothetical protein
MLLTSRKSVPATRQVAENCTQLQSQQAGQAAMRVFPKGPAAILLLLALIALLVVRGIVPAMSRIDSDFPGYFTAARIVTTGQPTDRLYDIPWFQEQLRRYGFSEPSAGKFAPFPPPTALLLVPVASLAPLNALRVLSGVSALCLVASIVLLSRVLAWSAVDSGIFVLLSGWAVHNSFRLGQPYILVSLCCILGYYAYLKGRGWSAGVSFGLFTPVKYFPVVLLIYFAFRKKWQVVAGGASAIAAVTAASIAVLGWEIHQQFLTSVLGNHLVARLSMQDPFSANFQSFDTLFRRLFVYDAIANPRPLLDAPLLQEVGVVVTKALILVAALATLIRIARVPQPTAPSIGLLGIVTLLLAPATATYHFVLLWLPVGLLVNYLLRERALPCAYFMLGTYAVIGFFPYGHAARFEGRGALTVFAYPRLFLLLVMFGVCVYCLWSRGVPGATGTQVRLHGALPDDGA